MATKKDYRSVESHGPGGIYCPCCNTWGCHPRNHKSLSRRRLRRIEKERFRKEKDYWDD